MSKVIQHLGGESNNFELRRGLKVFSSNPYSYVKSLLKKPTEVSEELSSGFSPRRSRTFGLSFRKESPVKKASNKSEMKVNSISDFDNEINRKKIVRLVGVSATVLLLTLLSLTILPVSSKPKTAEAASGTSSSTTLTIVKASADLDLTTIASSGTFATSSAAEMASFNVKTTNYTGYTLTISASDNTGTLTNTTSTGSFSSISGVIDEKTFDDASYNGKWGYKPSKINSTENVGFWPSPGTTATTLDVTKAPNPTTANEYTIALGARAAYTQPTGTYTKTTILTTTANPANYSVTYADNTGDASVTNIPDASTSSTSGTEIELSTVTPSRTGYVFNGWCDVAPTNSGTTCSGTTYAVHDSFPINQTTTNNITLYATWTVPSYSIVIKPTNGIASVSLNGQSCTNNAGCTVNNLTYGQTYTLTATMNDGYSFAAWSPEGAGTVADITSASTTFTVGQGTATITAIPAGAAAKTVTVNFAYAGGGTTGVSSVTFKESATGTTVGTVSTSGGTVKLNPGVGYTMTTNSATNYGVKSYAATAGTLADTASTSNTNYFTPGSSNATITVNTCLKTIGSSTTNMQGYSESINNMCDDATGQLKDSRDGQIYTVGVVTGNNGTSKTLWMTKNIAIGCNGSGATYGSGRSAKSLTSSNSNVSTTWSTGSAGELKDNTSSNSYTAPFMTCSNTYGAWYNYVAATANTINTADNSTEAAYSVCPSGWKLPSHAQISAAASNKTAFSPVAGGYYYGGTLDNTGNGYWWSSGASGGTNRWNLSYSSSYLYTGYGSRYYGVYVRCVRA